MRGSGNLVLYFFKTLCFNHITGCCCKKWAQSYRIKRINKRQQPISKAKGFRSTEVSSVSCPNATLLPTIGKCFEYLRCSFNLSHICCSRLIFTAESKGWCVKIFSYGVPAFKVSPKTLFISSFLICLCSCPYSLKRSNRARSGTFVFIGNRTKIYLNWQVWLNLSKIFLKIGRKFGLLYMLFWKLISENSENCASAEYKNDFFIWNCNSDTFRLKI